MSEHLPYLPMAYGAVKRTSQEISCTVQLLRLGSAIERLEHAREKHQRLGPISAHEIGQFVATIAVEPNSDRNGAHWRYILRPIEELTTSVHEAHLRYRMDEQSGYIELHQSLEGSVSYYMTEYTEEHICARKIPNAKIRKFANGLTWLIQQKTPLK
jgi:hypothetical protein